MKKTYDGAAATKYVSNDSEAGKTKVRKEFRQKEESRDSHKKENDDDE